MKANLGFTQTVYGVDYMNRELAYWRGFLNAALNTARSARHPYPNGNALRETLRALEVYWLGDSRDVQGWNAVCDSAYRAVTAFNQWAGKK